MHSSCIEYSFQRPGDKNGRISLSEIHRFLESVDCLFTPPLSLRVNLGKYSSKLFNNSFIFAALHCKKTIGLLAMYADEHGEYYIPILTISPDYQKQKIGKTLLHQGLSFFKREKGRRIQLEVTTDNCAAITLYKSMGFKEHEDIYKVLNFNKIKMVHTSDLDMNILLTSIGRRGYMINYFKDALAGRGEVHAGNSVETYAMKQADKCVLTPEIYDNSYIEFLKGYCKQHTIRAIIPLFDIDIPILAAHAKEFFDIGVTVFAPSPKFAKICNDKWETYCFLKDNGILTPKSYLNEKEAIHAIIKRELAYPLIIKPRWGMGSIGVYVADNEDELHIFTQKIKKEINNSYLKFESAADLEHSVIIQEKIHGIEYGLDIINDLNRRNVSVVVKQKLAMRAGETDVAEVLYHPELESIGNKLGNLSKHMGNLDVDCFINNKKIYILEMNCRFGGQYPFSHLAGVNLPAQIVSWLRGEPTNKEFVIANKPCIACKELTPVIWEKLY